MPDTSEILNPFAIIDNAYRKPIRHIKTRISFYKSLRSYAHDNTYTNLYYSYVSQHNYSSFTTVTHDSGIKRCLIRQECDGVPISTAVTSSIELEVVGEEYDEEPHMQQGGYVVPEVGILLPDNSWFWYSLGLFRIAELKKVKKYHYRILGYDEMNFLNGRLNISVSSRDVTAASFINREHNDFDISYFCDAETIRQLEQITLTVDDETILEQCKNEREIIGYIAGKVGKYAYFTHYFGEYGNEKYNSDDANGQVMTALRISSIKDNNEYDMNINWNTSPEYRIDFTGNEGKVQISNFSVGTKDTHTIASSSVAGKLYCYDNPLVTSDTIHQQAREEIYNAIINAIPSVPGFGYATYEIGELKTSGNPLLSLGQTVYFYDAEGDKHRILICAIEIEIANGLNMTITSKEPRTEFTI